MLWKQKLFGFWSLFAVDIQTDHVNSWTVLLKQCFLIAKLQKPFQWEELNQCIWLIMGLHPFLSHFCYLSWINQIFSPFSFDESLNQVNQTCEIDVYVRFWNVTELKVIIRFIGSAFFGHETHQNLLKHFHEVTKELDRSKLYQISMDGSILNLKFYNEIVQDRQENMVHSLIDIGSCSLHIVHGSFKTGAEKTGWNLKALLKGSFQILRDTPVRREDYQKCGSTCNQWLNCEIIKVLDLWHFASAWICLQPIYWNFFLF